MSASACSKLLLFVVTGLFAAINSSAQEPVDNSFNYQGQLNLAGGPLNDTADFEFTLWDTDAAGNQIGSTIARDNVPVVNGQFSVSLNFGEDAFEGERRFLEVSVRTPSGVGAFTALSPRQEFKATPYAQSLVPGARIEGAASSGLFGGVLSVFDTTNGNAISAFAGNTGAAVLGLNVETFTAGLLGDDQFGVYGISSTGWAGFFEQGDVYVADNLGLGLDAPETKLHMKGALLIAADATAPTIRLRDDEDLDEFRLQHNRANDELRIRNAANDNLMVIEKDGNVGIGTDAPAQTLDVNGMIATSGGIMFPDGSVQTSAAGGSVYIVTTRARGEFGGYPVPFCPTGWTIVESWEFETRQSAQSGVEDEWTQTLCRCDACP